MSSALTGVFLLLVVENEIKKTQASMGDVIQEEAAMTLYREVMGDPKAYIDSVAFKIDTIVNIWQTVCTLSFSRYIWGLTGV